MNIYGNDINKGKLVEFIQVKKYAELISVKSRQCPHGIANKSWHCPVSFFFIY